MKKNVITKAAAIITLIIMIFASCSQPDMKDKMTVNEVLYPFFKLVENEDGDWEIKVIAGSGMSDVTVPDSLKTPDGSNATIFGGFESESDRKGVQTVTIEDGITEIKDGAFQGASNLTDIEFSSSSSLDRIGNDAFNGTGLSDVKIPSSVTEIGDGAFANNGNLTDVDLSGLDDNTTVGTGAFDNTPVTNITVSAPNTTKDRMNEIFGNGYLGNVVSAVITGPGTVGNGFDGASDLTSVVIKDGVDGIGNNAFNNASSLANISLPSSVTSIGNNAFNSTTSLTAVELPSSLETIGENAFANCGDDEYTLPSSMKDVAANAFDGNDTVYITYDIYSNRNGEPVGSIVVKRGDSIIAALEEEKDTFAPFENAGVDFVTSFDGSKSGISSTYNDANDSLTLDAKLPSSLSGEAEENFISGKLVVDWRDPNVAYELTEGGESYVAAGLTEAGQQNRPDTVYVSGNHQGKPVTGIKDNAFGSADGNPVDMDVVFSDPSKITDIGSGAFQNNTGIKDDILKDFTNQDLTIGENAFAGTGITESTIPDGLTSIPNGMFNGASNLNSLKNPDGTHENVFENVSSIGKDAFKDTALSNDDPLKGSDVTSIGEGAFQGTDIGPTVTIPSSVTGLGQNSFADNDSIKDVIIESGSGLSADDIAKAFGTTDESGKITKPSSATSLTIPADLVDSQKEIDALVEAFPNLKDLNIVGDGSNELNGSFSGFENLEKVVISGVTTIGKEDPAEGEKGAFEGLGNLTSVTLPEGLEVIGGNAFSGSSLKDVATADENGVVTEEGKGKLPSTVTTIGDNAFADTDLRNPAGIYDAETGEVSGGLFDLIDNNTSNPGLSIGDNAFAGTSVGLAVKLPENTTSVGAGAFDDVALGNTITIPSSVESLGEGAFTGNDRNDSITSVVVEPNASENITGETIADAFADITGDAESGFETNNPASTVKELTIPVDMVDTQEEVDAIHAAFPNLEKITITGGDKGVTTIPSDVSFDKFDKVTDLVIGEGVTGISTTPENEKEGNGTFAGMYSLTSVTLPEGLEIIGDNAFSGNKNLTEVATADKDGVVTEEGRGKLPSVLETVGDNAFANTGISGDVFAGNDGRLTSIGDGAFEGVTGNLGDEDGKLTIPGTVTTIGEDAFKGTDSIKDVTIPSNVESLGSGAFVDTGLTSVTIEDNPNFEGDNREDLHNAFMSKDENGNVTSSSDKVTSLTIPENLFSNTLTPEAFPNVEEIRITESANGANTDEDGIKLGVLEDLKAVTVDGGVDSKVDYTGVNITQISIAADELTENGAPDKLKGKIETVVVVPNEKAENGTTVPGGAFAGAGNIEEVRIEEGITAVGSTGEGSKPLFGEEASNSVTVELPSSVGTIGDNTFKGDNITIKLPEEGAENIKTVGDSAFEGNKNVTNDILDKLTGLESIGDNAFKDTGISGEVTIPGTVSDLGSGAFAGNDGITSVVVEPNANVEITGQTIAGAFMTENEAGADSVTSLTIPVDMIQSQEDVEALHKAFPNLEKITITGGTKGSASTIPSDVSFSDFDTVKEIVIEEGVTGISTTEEGETAGKGTFAGMDSLTSVTLPEGLTNIGDNAFSGNESLKNVATSSADGSTVTNGRLPSTVETVGDNAFANTGISGDIFAGNDSLKEIGDGAFSGITGSLGDKDGMLTLPEGLTSIGDNAFNGTESLKGVSASNNGTVTEGGKNKLPSTVTNIGDNAFKDTSLKSPAGEKDSETGVVSGGLFDRIENNSANEGLTIGDGAFAGTNVGPAVSLPDNTVSVGGGAFAGINNADGTAPGKIDVKIPAQLTGNPDGDSEKEGLAGIFTDEGNKNVAIGNLTVTAGDEENEKAVDLINPADESASDITVDNVILEEGLTSIEDGAFADTGVKEVATLDKENGTSSVTDDVLPGSLENIGKDAFADTELSSPAGVIDENGNISGGLFDRIEKDENNNGLTIGEGAFANTNVGPVVNIPSNTASAGDGAFSGLKDNTTGSAVADGELDIRVPANLTGDSNDDGTVEGVVGIFTDPEGQQNELTAGTIVIAPSADGETTVGSLAGTGDTITVNDKITLEDGITDTADNAFSSVSGSSDRNGALAVDVPASGFDAESVTSAVNVIIKDENGKASILVVSEDKATAVTGSDVASAFDASCVDKNSVTSLSVPSSMVQDQDAVDALVKEFPNVKDLTITKADGEGNDTIPSDVSFAGFGKLESVALGEGIISVGAAAEEGETSKTGPFAGIDSLTSVKLPSTLTTVGDNAFADSGLTGTLVLPEGLKTVGDNAFGGNENINKISIGTDGVEQTPDRLPSTLTSIGDEAFAGTGVTSPAGEMDENGNISGGLFEEIGNNSSNTGLAIGENAFANTNVGPVVNLPENISSAGEGAFAGINNEDGTAADSISVKVPAHLTGDPDGDGVKEGVSGIFTNDTAASVVVDNLIITPSDETDGKIVDRIAGETSTAADPDIILGNVVIEDGITSIGDSAFTGTGAVSADEGFEITLPSSVSTIGKDAFKDTALTGNPLDENTGITSVGSGAFQNTDIGETVSVPSTVTSLGESAFATEDGENGNITSVVISPNGKFTGEDIAKSFATLTEDASGNYTTNNPASSVKELTIPVDMIQSQKDVDALYEAFPNLEKITITGGADESVTTIPSDVSFDEFDKVTDLVIGNGITEIGTTTEGDTTPADGPFAGMDNLTSVTLPEDLEVIGDNAFNGNENLTDVATANENGVVTEEGKGKLPAAVTEIGDNAFAGTGLGRGDSSVSGGEYDESLSGREDVITGGLFENIEGPLTIGSGAFADTEIGPTVNLPDTTTSVGEGAFAGVTPKNEGENGGLNVKVPAGVTGPYDENGNGTIDADEEKPTLSDIFTDPSSPSTSPAIIDNLIVTGDNGDNNTVGKLTEPSEDGKTTDLILDNVVIGTGVENIGDNAFSGTGTLDDGDDTLTVTLPEGLEAIGEGAFQNAPALSDENGNIISSDEGALVIIGGDDPETDKGRLPSSVTEIGDDAFKDSGLGKGQGDENIGGTYDPVTGEFADGILSGLGNGGSDDVTIGEGAFENTNIGPVVNIPDNITEVGDHAFAGITPKTDADGNGLDIRVPASMTGDHDGDGNAEDDSLADIFTPSTGLPADPVHIGNLVISPAGDDTSVGKLTDDDSVDLVVDKVVIDEGITEIEDGALAGVATTDDNDDPDHEFTLQIPGSLLGKEPGNKGLDDYLTDTGNPEVTVDRLVVTGDDIGKIVTDPDGGKVTVDVIEFTEPEFTIDENAFDNITVPDDDNTLTVILPEEAGTDGKKPVVLPPCPTGSKLDVVVGGETSPKYEYRLVYLSGSAVEVLKDKTSYKAGVDAYDFSRAEGGMFVDPLTFAVSSAEGPSVEDEAVITVIGDHDVYVTSKVATFSITINGETHNVKYGEPLSKYLGDAVKYVVKDSAASGAAGSGEMKDVANAVVTSDLAGKHIYAAYEVTLEGDTYSKGETKYYLHGTQINAAGIGTPTKNGTYNGLEFDSWTASTTTVTGGMTLSPVWKVSVPVNTGSTTVKNVDVLIGKNADGQNYTIADALKKAGLDTGVYALGNGSAVQTENPFSDASSVATYDNVNGKQINAYYQFNAKLNGMTASAGGTDVSTGNYVKQGTVITVNAGSAPDKWSTVSGNIANGSGQKVSNTITVNGAVVSDSYYPIYQTTVNVNGSSNTVEYSAAPGYGNKTFGQLTGFNTSDGAVYAFGTANKATSVISDRTQVNPSTLQNTVISKYYQCGLTVDGETIVSTGYYKDGTSVPLKNPTKVYGGTFEGWVINGADKGKNPSVSVSELKGLSSSNVSAKISYTISINGTDTVKVYRGGVLSFSLPNFGQSGYKYTYDSAGTSSVTAGDTVNNKITGNTTIYKWAEVKFVADRGNISNNQSIWVKTGTSIPAESLPTVTGLEGTGYKFTGWNVSGNISGPVEISAQFGGINGMDMSDPRHFYFKIGDEIKALYLADNYLTSEEYEDRPAPEGYNKLTTYIASVLGSLTQDEKNRLSAWIYYWHYEAQTRTGNQVQKSSRYWTTTTGETLLVEHALPGAYGGTVVPGPGKVDAWTGWDSFPDPDQMLNSNGAKPDVRLESYTTGTDTQSSAIYWK